MKKRILLLTAVAGMSALALSSYITGPAANGYDCTGAEAMGTGSFANPTGCSASAICHGTVGGSTSTISVALELDSAGVATSHYRPGKMYTIKITGTNTSGLTLPRYGFQLAVLKGTTSTTTNVDAGVLSGAPASTHIQPPGANTALTIAEHSTPLTQTGTTFTQTFTWSAPATNVGSVSIWGAANFVNNDGGASAADKWNTKSIQIAVWPSTESVAALNKELAITAFPNPATNQLNLQLENAAPGTYSLHVFSMNGSLVSSQALEVNDLSQTNQISTSNWMPGIYCIVVEKDGNQKTLMVAKQ